MNTFLKKIGLFLCVLIIIVILTSMGFNSYIGNKAVIKLDSNINNVVFGHSHAECAFNDSLISNFKNLAESGESYFYTYIKAKQVLEHNPQLKTVFIEYANVDVALEKDKDIWSDKYINWRYPVYSALMDAEEHFFLLSKNPKSIIETLPKTFKKQLSKIKNNKYNFGESLGGYKHLEESKLDSLLKVGANLKKSHPDYFKASKENLLYLHKIISICKEKKLKIYLIRSPMFLDSYYVSNEELLQNILKDQFADIAFLDFKDFPLNNDEYRDLNHINYRGSIKFSKWFNTFLNEEFKIDTLSKNWRRSF